MKNLVKHVYCLLALAIVPILGCADENFVAPLAKNAKTIPDVVKKTLWGQEIQQIRVANSVYLGSHEFDSLEKYSRKVIDEYDQGKITGDEFITNMHLLVPLVGQEMAVPNMLLWTQKKPNSYGAWYALGRLYCHLAEEARGTKYIQDTPPEDLEDSDRYAKLAYDALEKSMSLHGKPMPSYRTAIENSKLIRSAKRSTNFIEIPKKYTSSRDYLEKAAKIEPNSVKIYEVYFNRATPRWGGSYEALHELIEEAHKKGMSDNSFARVKASLLNHQAYDAKTLSLDSKMAAVLYEKAFDAYPNKKYVGYLIWAAKSAMHATDYDSAVRILTKAIAIDPNCYECFFGRGTIYRVNLENYNNGFSDMASSALLGYAYAQNNIGYYYLTGDHGYPVNLQEAKAWFTLSANQGYDHAKEKLALVNQRLQQTQ